jgi:hypothetical protein
MARFYAEIQGSRGEASRMGTAYSGMHGHIRGWHVGASVDMYAEDENNGDRAAIYATFGSAGNGSNEPIGSVRNVDGVLELTPSAWTIAQVDAYKRRERNAARRQARIDAKRERIERYRKYRADGIPAHWAWKYAGHVAPSFDWQECGDGMRATLKRAGFDVTIDAKPDYDGFGMEDGTFTDTRTADAVRIPDCLRDRHSYRYFVPMISYAEHVKGLRDMGIARHDADCLARSYVLRDMRAAVSGREYYWLDVRVSRGGIELGRDSLGGIEFGDDARERELDATVDDHGMINNAITSATDALAKLN